MRFIQTHLIEAAKTACMFFFFLFLNPYETACPPKANNRSLGAICLVTSIGFWIPSPAGLELRERVRMGEFSARSSPFPRASSVKGLSPRALKCDTNFDQAFRDGRT